MCIFIYIWSILCIFENNKKINKIEQYYWPSFLTHGSIQLQGTSLALAVLLCLIHEVLHLSSAYILRKLCIKIYSQENINYWEKEKKDLYWYTLIYDFCLQFPCSIWCGFCSPLAKCIKPFNVSFCQEKGFERKKKKKKQTN